MRATFEARGADLVLGVFPTAKPKELGPVRFDADMRVTEVQDKPAETDLANSWGLAIWGARFSEMIAAAPPNANLGLLFHQAAQKGLDRRSPAGFRMVNSMTSARPRAWPRRCPC